MTTRLDRGIPRHSRYIACALLLGAALTAASCDDSKLPTNPTTFGLSTVSFSTASDVVIAQPVSQPFCPTVAPFTVPFVVVVHSDGTTGLVVTQIQMQFTDSHGVSMPQITLPAPVPINEFGSQLTAVRDLRFPLALGVGCGVGHTGNIVVVFDTRDDHGKQASGQVKVEVR